MLIDVHCHFFNKDMLSNEIIKLGDSIPTSMNSPLFSFLRKRVHYKSDAALEQFISYIMQTTPRELYNVMKSVYNRDFIAVPLMVDFTYTMENPYIKSDRKSLDRILNIREDLMLKTQDKNTVLASWAKKRLDSISNINFNIFRDSYDAQLKSLSQLKHDLPDRIYPFYGIDPRKDEKIEGGILGQIKKYVGKDKIFHGLKLYSALGYSPTDPALYDDSDGECVYSYCERMQIPITLHFGSFGFSHILHKNIVKGHVYDKMSGEAVPIEAISRKKLFIYSDNTLGDSSMIERQWLLNHPKLWKLVLNKYPKLRVNFAHFGGSEQMADYIEHPFKGYWVKELIDMLCNYKNTYSDISFFDSTTKSKLKPQDYYDNIYKKLPSSVKKKVMYGSDFMTLSLIEDDLEKYYNNFKDSFGKDFEKISEDNSSRFLML